MLSIIVCSINKNNLFRLQTNIKTTAVFNNEIIIYENDDKKGLCEVYNLCAAKAVSQYVCFVHDDVLFHTNGWDEKIIHHLNFKDTGVIGSMGGRYKSTFGTSWNDGSIDMHRYNAKNGCRNGVHLFFNPKKKSKDEVVCLDGAFIFCTKNVWEQNKFDEQKFRGFHFYDLDFCLRVFLSGLKNYVVYDLLIEHFSVGTKDASFLKQFFLFKEKWENILPLFIDTLSKKEVSNFEGYALGETIILLKENKSEKKKATQLIKHYKSRYRNPYQFLRLLYLQTFE